MLSGIGADELFGGYPSFHRIHLAKLAQAIPDIVLNASQFSSQKRINRLSYLQLNGIKGLYLFLRGMFSTNEIAKQLGAYESDIWKTLQSQPVFMEVDELEAKNQASWMEYHLYMQNQLLRDADVMSMQHGIEIRVPFVSSEVVSTAFKTAGSIKFAGRSNKQLLAEAFSQDLPAAILQRKKMGFGFPFAEWLKESDFVQNIFQESNSNTKRYQQNFLSGKLHWAQFMTLLIIEYRTQQSFSNH